MGFRIGWALGLLALGCGSDFESSGGSGGAAGEVNATGGKFAAAATGGTSAGGAATGGAASGGQSSGGAPVRVCVPGKSEQCTGPAGCQGGQACKNDGSGFGECVCEVSGSGGSGGSAGGGAEPPTFTGPDGQQWACQRYDGEGTGNHRCECVRYPAKDHPWHCDEPGYNCSPVACTVYAKDCCLGYPGSCMCTGPLDDCSKIENPLTSCP